MFYAAHSDPKIFISFNTENKMYMFSGEIPKGTEISLWTGEVEADGKTIMQMHDS